MKNGLTIACASKGTLDKYKVDLIKKCGVTNVEFIGLENNLGSKGLSEFYNEVINKAKNDYIVFLHDDLVIETKHWGRKILTHFNKSDYGILGLAGTTTLTDSGRWWDDNTKMIGAVMHQGELINPNYKEGGNQTKMVTRRWLSQYSNNFGKEIIETILVDGLFIAINRKKIKKQFNPEFKFHFYDIDFTFNNHKEDVKVGVIFDILVTHLSIGETNEEWETNRKKFVINQGEKLPHTIIPQIRYNNKKIKLKHEPMVSIIIPTKGNTDLLFDTINSIIKITSYNNYEIIIADTGSTPKEIMLIDAYRMDKPKIKLVEYDYYNFGKINNDVVKNHLNKDTQLIIFANNDIIILTDVISQMVQEYQKNKNVGTVGCRLHYGDNTIQHSGVILFSLNKSKLDVTHYGLKSFYKYYDYKGDVLGNTAALMLTPLYLFNKIGGFNENYIECFEDVEYNLQCILANKKNKFLGDAVAYHYESQTRNNNTNKNQQMNIDWVERLLPFIKNNNSLTKYINKT